MYAELNVLGIPMILVGQYDSPFVRRVAVTLHHYGMAFDHQVLSVFGDFAEVSAVNPLGQVPALVLDDGETLIDSQAILDHLDEGAVPGHRLTPPAGATRRKVLLSTAVALGVAAKAVALSAEERRQERGTYDPEWAGRLAGQIASGMVWLERRAPAPWLAGPRLSQADATLAVAHTYLERKHPRLLAEASYPALGRLARACETLPAFRAVPFPTG